ncbi:Delta2-dienoyl-CoA-isomerase [Mycena belliarum]|uniref:Delta2-dienoyl-CoA-isomerase n=1 Tax=Mycena belliarum TaxID=1033014 RepID=A0AAD6U6H0_9AGAR|nr:Delta2-dienoyl-CoA-isomerase [Mycena belliae]
MTLAEGLSSKFLLVSEPSPYVLHIELARKPVNAFSVDFWTAYGALFDRIVAEGRDVRAVVLSSALPKLFTAGIDVADLANTGIRTDGARASLAIRQHILEFQHAISAPERCPFPVIAAVHGLVVGLGLDIISACDIRYAAENAQFTIKEVDVGLAADIGTLAHLPKITGNHSLMRELAYSARLFSATEAAQLGLLSRAVPGARAEVVAAALALARAIASKSPVAVSGTKRVLMHARDHSVAENLEYTAVWNAAALHTDDVTESLRASKTRSAATFAPLRKAAPKL